MTEKSFEEWKAKNLLEVENHVKWLLDNKKWYTHRDILMLNPHLHSIELREEKKIIGGWDKYEECWKYPTFQFQENDLHPLTQRFVNLVYSVGGNYHLPDSDKGGWRKMFYIFQPYRQLNEQVMTLQLFHDRVKHKEDYDFMRDYMRTDEFEAARKLSDECFGLAEFFEPYPEYTIRVLEKYLYDYQHPEQNW